MASEQPNAGAQARRVFRRRLGDRLLSLVSPRKRYTCRAFGCGWEGAIRDAATAAATSARGLLQDPVKR